MTRCALYRHYDAGGVLLYVGISANPLQRSARHAASARWFGDVATIRIEWFDSRAEAVSAEAVAIERETPRHNGGHPPAKTARSRMSVPEMLIASFGDASAFASACTEHPLAPGRVLTRAAVYQWRRTGTVPHMWRPVIQSLSGERGAA